MGWFSWSSPPKDPDAHTREGRQQCWEKRDAYFTCLDRAGVVKPGDEGKTCEAEAKAYEGNCAKSWIEYFNQRRVIAEAQKDRLAQSSQQTQSSARSGR